MRWRDCVCAAFGVALFVGVCSAQEYDLVPPVDSAGGAPHFAREYFGLHMHHPDAIRWPAAKFGSWRLWDAGISWADIERSPGQYDFARLDRYVLMGERFRLELVLPVAITPLWASSRPAAPGAYGPGKASPPRNLDDWQRFVHTLAKRYKGRIAAYELWNESNIPAFFDGDISALASMARIFAQEIHSVDPAAKVVAPSGAGLLDPRKDFVAKFLRSARGVRFDAYSFHLYTGEHKPEVMIPHVQALQAQVREAGLGALPLWNTESGYSVRSKERGFGSTDATAQEPELVAAYLVRAMLIARALGVERFHWYAWDDGRMAMTMADLATPNAIGRAYSRLIPVLEGARLKRCHISRSGPCLCQLVSADKRAFGIAWSSKDQAEEWLPGEPVHVFAWDGRALSSGVVNKVTLGPMPVVFEQVSGKKGALK